MFLTQKHLSRRTVLKGAGATIALPLLDAMIPAGTALAQTAAAPSSRAWASSTSRTARCRTNGQPKTDRPRLRLSVHPQAARTDARLRDRRQRPAQQGWGELEPARHHRGDLAELRQPAAAQCEDRASA